MFRPMLSGLFLGAAVLVSAPAPLSSHTPRAHVGADTSAAAATKLFTALEGKWSCSGAFANGRPLNAELSFLPDLDGRTLRFRHEDRAPSTYVQAATWGLDATSKQIVSLAFSASAPGQPAAPGLYVARSWTDRSLMLEADTLLSPPWAPNRFTYTVERPDSLRMVWEVNRGGEWRMGDYLECRRAIATR